MWNGAVEMRKICIVTPNVYGYGALLIGGVLKHENVHVILKKGLDFTIPQVDMLGISVHSVTDLLRCRKLVEVLRKQTNAFLVIGGSATLEPELVFKLLPQIDAVVIGEGEVTVIEVLRYLNRETTLDSIKGIAFLQDGKIMRTETREPADLSGRPLPLIPRNLRLQNIRGGAVIQGANIYMETHRGCMASCTFCLVPSLCGRTIRSRPLNEILTEARTFKEAGVERIALIGGTTSMYGEESGSNNGIIFAQLLRRLCHVVGKANLNAGDLRVDSLNSTILKAIKQHTVGWISLGLESGSDRILRKMSKGIDTRIIREGVREARNSDIRVIGSFIIGYPGEEQEDFQATLDLMRELHLDDYAINLAEPIPGTPMYKMMISTKIEDNLFFKSSDEKIANAPKLTVAEYRATVMQKIAYEIIFQKNCPIAIFEKFLKRSMNECSRIREMILACRN